MLKPNNFTITFPLTENKNEATVVGSRRITQAVNGSSVSPICLWIPCLLLFHYTTTLSWCDIFRASPWRWFAMSELPTKLTNSDYLDLNYQFISVLKQCKIIACLFKGKQFSNSWVDQLKYGCQSTVYFRNDFSSKDDIIWWWWSKFCNTSDI